VYKSSELTTNSYPQLDSLYNLLLTNTNLIIEIAAHTDGIGSNEYNLTLSQKRAESIKKYLISKGISPNRLVSKGYGETSPLEIEVFSDGTDNENARQRNRRCEFKILKITSVEKAYNDKTVMGHEEITSNRNENNLLNQQLLNIEKPISLKQVNFVYKSTVLTTNSYPQLDSLYNLLLANTNIIIEIAAHTDGIGSNEYNLTLSQKRAESIKKYLISKGINPNRLVSKGYGETRPLEIEVFSDGTDNENARQRNRRCEFKILNKLKN